MEIGRGPLNFVRNQLRCAACDARLPGRAAGARIVAEHRGPVLVGVTITLGTRELHACEIAKPVKQAG